MKHGPKLGVDAGERQGIRITRRSILTAGGLAILAGGRVGAQPATTATTTRRIPAMNIKRNGSQPSGKGPADY